MVQQPFACTVVCVQHEWATVEIVSPFLETHLDRNRIERRGTYKFRSQNWKYVADDGRRD